MGQALSYSDPSSLLYLQVSVADVCLVPQVSNAER